MVAGVVYFSVHHQQGVALIFEGWDYTPHHGFEGSVPDVSNLRTVGCLAWAHVHSC